MKIDCVGGILVAGDTDMALGKGVGFRVDIMQRPMKAVLVFDSHVNCVGMPWRHAIVMAETIEEAVKTTRQLFGPIPAVLRQVEEDQVRLSHREGTVMLSLECKKRVTFSSIEAVWSLAQKLRAMAKTADLAERGTKGHYDIYGRLVAIENSKGVEMVGGGSKGEVVHKG